MDPIETNFAELLLEGSDYDSDEEQSKAQLDNIRELKGVKASFDDLLN